MLNRLLRLRACCFLALLAGILLAGVLPHGHAQGPDRLAVGTMVAAVADGEAPTHGPAAQAHCGTCHATRAVVPLPAGPAAPAILPGAVPVPDLAAAPEGQHDRVPPRPPRAVTIA